MTLAAELKQVTNETGAIVRLGRGRLASGEPLRALECADRALALARMRDARGTAAHAMHLRASVLAARDAGAAAETYRAALAQAEQRDLTALLGD